MRILQKEILFQGVPEGEQRQIDQMEQGYQGQRQEQGKQHQEHFKGAKDGAGFWNELRTVCGAGICQDSQD